MWTSGRARSPIIPKTSFYKGDGSGRDAYILKDSGGFIKGGVPAYAGSSSRPISGKRPPSARYDGKPLHYHSDGTGRDKYIVQDCGGLLRNYKPDNFFHDLRTYEKSVTPTSKDYFGLAQRIADPKEQIEMMQRSITVKNVVNRLSSPKPNPYLNSAPYKNIYSYPRNKVSKDLAKSAL